MNAKDVTALASRVSRVCGLDRYTWVVEISTEQPTPDDDHPESIDAMAHVHGLNADIVLYPSFDDHDLGDKVDMFLHEIAHVVVSEYVFAAEAFADDRKDALAQIEERLCDTIARLLAASCREAGVDFGVLM